jgi:pimeloyl-ACP methyl ester carboxylesterase
MIKVFLIPGLGADYRIYKNIDLQGNDGVNVSWVEPDKNDTLASYAQKLIDKYQITAGSIVIGNSLGGMLAVEIANKIELNKVILISSIKSVHEIPASFKWFRFISIYRILPAKLFTSLGIFVKYAFGKMTKTDQQIFIDMLENTPPVFAKWAVGAILHWNNQVVPDHVYHIHGDKDKIFPSKRLRDATIIQGGTHIMIFNRAKEINTWLKNILLL